MERGLGHRQTRDLIGLHRKVSSCFGKGKSQAGRPRIPENIRKLIVQMWSQKREKWAQARDCTGDKPAL